MDNSLLEGPEINLSATEVELLREIIRGLRSVRYGSVNLKVHDGRLAEIQKLERIRMTTKAKKVTPNVK